MPKVSIKETDSQSKKAPRKRATSRASVTSETPLRKKARLSNDAVSNPLARKAPARVTTPEKRKNSSKVYVVIVALVLATFGAAGIGFSDSGQINVNQIINERNQKQADKNVAEGGEGENNGQTMVVPVQNSVPSVPNAGLRGRGVGTPDIVSEVLPEAEATSTEATTTEALPDETSVTDVSATETLETESGTPELVQ